VYIVYIVYGTVQRILDGGVVEGEENNEKEDEGGGF